MNDYEDQWHVRLYNRSLVHGGGHGGGAVTARARLQFAGAETPPLETASTSSGTMTSRRHDIPPLPVTFADRSASGSMSARLHAPRPPAQPSQNKFPLRRPQDFPRALKAMHSVKLKPEAAGNEPSAWRRSNLLGWRRDRSDIARLQRQEKKEEEEEKPGHTGGHKYDRVSELHGFLSQKNIQELLRQTNYNRRELYVIYVLIPSTSFCV